MVGYAFYAAAFATAASLVSRQEDLQSVITPLTLVLLIGFFVSFGVVSDPDGTLAKVSSFIPPIAPMTMPPRIALGEASAVEIVGAFAVTIGATRCSIPLAARIYSGAVLRMGATIKLRDAWRAARSPRRRRPPPDRAARHCERTAARRRSFEPTVDRFPSLRARARPARGSDQRALRRPVVAGPGHDELVDPDEVPADAVGHLVEDPPRAVDPARRRVSCDLIRRTSSIAASARSTSMRSPPASSPSPPASAISVRARASE